MQRAVGWSIAAPQYYTERKDKMERARCADEMKGKINNYLCWILGRTLWKLSGVIQVLQPLLLNAIPQAAPLGAKHDLYADFFSVWFNQYWFRVKSTTCWSTNGTSSGLESLSSSVDQAQPCFINSQRRPQLILVWLPFFFVWEGEGKWHKCFLKGELPYFTVLQLSKQSLAGTRYPVTLPQKVLWLL